MSTEQNYANGHRAAWVSMLNYCLVELGFDDPAAGSARWISEREEAVSRLRTICEHHGDNDWDNDLHLADVIEKHLERYLDEN